MHAIFFREIKKQICAFRFHKNRFCIMQAETICIPLLLFKKSIYICFKYKFFGIMKFFLETRAKNFKCGKKIFLMVLDYSFRHEVLLHL
jgi:hypothetical protein